MFHIDAGACGIHLPCKRVTGITMGKSSTVRAPPCIRTILSPQVLKRLVPCCSSKLKTPGRLCARPPRATPTQPHSPHRSSSLGKAKRHPMLSAVHEGRRGLRVCPSLLMTQHRLRGSVTEMSCYLCLSIGSIRTGVSRGCCLSVNSRDMSVCHPHHLSFPFFFYFTVTRCL